jgi:hypothetical protein
MHPHAPTARPPPPTTHHPPPAPAHRRIAKILRKRRAEAGALQLASPEVKFKIDTETHDPLDVGMYQVGRWGRWGRWCRAGWLAG